MWKQQQNLFSGKKINTHTQVNMGCTIQKNMRHKQKKKIVNEREKKIWWRYLWMKWNSLGISLAEQLSHSLRCPYPISVNTWFKSYLFSNQLSGNNRRWWLQNLNLCHICRQCVLNCGHMAWDWSSAGCQRHSVREQNEVRSLSFCFYDSVFKTQ